ncbi:MAG: hypothetical protein MJ065_10145 [Oscillospiraceae bacterium]|nr:hypothetical protein [Oscillospiraceae bacterium]
MYQTQNTAFLKPDDEQFIMRILHQYADQLGLDYTEFEIAGFLTLALTPRHDYNTQDFFLSCTSGMIFVRQFSAITDKFSTPEKRAAFLASLRPEELPTIRVEDYINDEEFEKLRQDPAPSMFRFLAAFKLAELLTETLRKYSASIYRTKAQAENAIRAIPQQLAVPTLQNYQYVMSLKASGNAYLQPLASTDGLKFSDGKMYFIGNDIQPVSEVELQNMTTNEGIETIELGMLRIFYSIILTEFEKTRYKELRDVITLYVPDLAECMGLQRNLNKQAIQRIIDTIQSFHTIVGVMHGTRNGKPSQSLYPVLNFEGYDDKRNTISFSSPYMNMVIKTVYKLAIERKKNGEPKLTHRGDVVRKPSHTFLVKTSIVKERNKAAVENVLIIAQLIEQCGDHTPHISALTLIERNPQFEQRLAAAKNKTTLLKRVFETTWRILREQTHLEERYPGIELPDPKDPAMLPTLKNVNTIVFTFTHHGKKKGEGKDQQTTDAVPENEKKSDSEPTGKQSE